MKSRFPCAALLLLISLGTPALAAASREEAQRLTGVFQTYLGTTPGVVSVTANGDSFDVRIDFAPLIALAPGKDFTATVTPLDMKLIGQGGGKWLVTQDQTFSFALTSPGVIDLTAKVASLRGSGIFDEQLTAFISSTTDLADFVVDETVTTPDAGATHMAYTIKSLHYETTMEAGASGGVDGNATSVVMGFAETVAMATSPGGPPMNLNITIESGRQDMTLKGLRSRPVLDVMAWLVAHLSQQAIIAGQAELKALLRAGLPLFESISSSATFETISATTPVGTVGIDKIGFGLSMSGIVADGRFQEKFSASGLKLPDGLVPAWAKDLVPISATVDFTVSGYDAATPAALMLDNLDLAKDPPLKPELEQQLLAALLPKGTVTLSLGPSSVIARLAELAAEGSMTAGPAAPPSGQATVKAKGVEQLIQVFQSAPPEMGMQQAVGLLIAAKGMSKQEPDGGLSWKFESTPAGGVLINGIDPSKM